MFRRIKMNVRKFFFIAKRVTRGIAHEFMEKNNYRFITNLDRGKKEIYIEAAKKYGIDYHICNNATDINGRPIDLLAFYVHNSYDSLDEFWKILDNLKYSKKYRRLPLH